MFSKLAELLKAADIVYYEPVDLSGGGDSDYYVDVKKAMGIPSLLKEMAEQLYLKIPSNVNAIVAKGYGGIGFAAIISAEHDYKLTQVRDTVKQHGRNKGLLESHLPQKGDKYVIIDDVWTTGHTVREVKKLIEENGAQVVKVLTVIFRGEEHPDDIDYDYLVYVGELVKLFR